MIILEEIQTKYGKIVISESKKTGFRSYCQSECFHSEAQSSGISTCAYIHVMYQIIRQAHAKKVLVIGCAAGSLPTMLDRIGCQVDVVDINPYAFSIARKYFQMPRSVGCYLMDGGFFLKKSQKKYDAIAIDAFDQDGVIPEQFLRAEFFDLVRRKLKRTGIVVVNTLVETDEDPTPDSIDISMKKAGLPVVRFDWPMLSSRNVVIAGGIVHDSCIESSLADKTVRDDLRGIVCLRS